MVSGDIDRRLVNRYGAMLSGPLHIIFHKAFATQEWPDLWKQETVTLLPKNKSPESLAQLRNISCTPFFSKLLETFILDGLKNLLSSPQHSSGARKVKE